MISGNHRADVVARSLSARSVGRACIRCDKKLIRSENQFCRPSLRHFGPRNLNQLAPAGEFFLKGVFGFQRENLLPGFGGRDNGLEALEQYTELKTIWITLR